MEELNIETNAPTEYGKYVDECLNEAAKHFFSEGKDKYTVADLFYAGIKCKEDWLEKQSEQKSNPYSGVSFEYNGHIWGMCARDGGVEIGCDKQLIAYVNLPQEKDEFAIKSIKEIKVDNGNNIKPKFKVSDWIIDKSGLIQQILDFRGGIYTCTYNSFTTDCESNYHLWTINDAKDGDILYHIDSASSGIFIFKEIRNDGKVLCYCDYDSEDHFCLGEHHTCCWTSSKYIKPATKEQREFLFQKMKEAGYKWDSK